MITHIDNNSADPHHFRQVLINPLKQFGRGCLIRAMKTAFKTAFLWHREATGVSLAELARKTGVSIDVLKKLNASDPYTTSAENAVLIASYFGKTVNQFLEMTPIDQEQAAANLFELLTTEERRILEAQIRGLLQNREMQ